MKKETEVSLWLDNIMVMYGIANPEMAVQICL